MTKILTREELNEMEVRIYQTYGMGKFSPKDVMDLIHTAQYYQLNYQEALKTIKMNNI